TGSYHFTVTANTTFTSSGPTQTLTPLQLNKAATTPLQVTPNTIITPSTTPGGQPTVSSAPGAGIIEAANANDVIPFHADAGDAADIELIKNDLNLRSYGIHQISCGSPVAPTVRWTLRDPSGIVLVDQTLFAGSTQCQNGVTGPMVFPRTGTYT